MSPLWAEIAQQLKVLTSSTAWREPASYKRATTAGLWTGQGTHAFRRRYPPKRQKHQVSLRGNIPGMSSVPFMSWSIQARSKSRNPRREKAASVNGKGNTSLSEIHKSTNSVSLRSYRRGSQDSFGHFRWRGYGDTDPC